MSIKSLLGLVAGVGLVLSFGAIGTCIGNAAKATPTPTAVPTAVPVTPTPAAITVAQGTLKATAAITAINNTPAFLYAFSFAANTAGPSFTFNAVVGKTYTITAVSVPSGDQPTISIYNAAPAAATLLASTFGTPGSGTTTLTYTAQASFLANVNVGANAGGTVGDTVAFNVTTTP